MAIKLRTGRLNSSATRVSRRSHTVKHAKIKLTVSILVLMLIAVGVYQLVRQIRTDTSRGGVEVVVGSNLMACIAPADVEQELLLLDALDKAAVRPASRQMLVLSGSGFNLELTAQEAAGLTLLSEGETLALVWDGERLGELQRVYLPTDAQAVKPLE